MEVKGNNWFSRLTEKRLVLFTGKGGVGKSSVAAAFALGAVRSGRRVLLLEMGQRRQLPALLGNAGVGDGPRPLQPGLEWMNLGAERALETYGMLKLRLRTVYRAVFEHGLVKRFLQAVPALAELLILGHVAYLVEQEPDRLVVVDAPASGQGRQMLQAPLLVRQTVAGGPLYQAVNWMAEIVGDPGISRVVVLTIPEELAINEALELRDQLAGRLNLPLGPLLANRVLPPALEEEHRQLLQRVSGGGRLGRLATAALRIDRRLREQQAFLERLRQADPELVVLPEVVDDADGAAAVCSALARLVRGQESGT